MKSKQAFRIPMSIYVSKTAQIIGDVAIEDGSSIWHGAILRADLDRISIGKYTNIQDNMVIHLDTEYPAIIGDRVTAGHIAIIHGCTIGDDCVIGMGSVIGNGAVIRNQSIVAPGAVVPENAKFPEKSVIAGVPAKIAKRVDDRLRHRIEVSWKIYYELAKRTLPAKPLLEGNKGKRINIPIAREIAEILEKKTLSRKH